MGRIRRLLIACVLVVCGGCALPQDDAPREIAADGLPRVLREQTPSTSTSLPKTDRTQKHVIYLVKTQGTTESLEPVELNVPLPNDPAQLPQVILDSLMSTVSVADHPDLTSAIHGVQVRSVSLSDERLDINLSSLGNVVGSGQRLAVAQIVFTATEPAPGIPTISSVRFSIEGTPTPVNVDDRTAAAGDKISRIDFPKLAPGGATTTTSTDTEPVPEDGTSTP